MFSAVLLNVFTEIDRNDTLRHESILRIAEEVENFKLSYILFIVLQTMYKVMVEQSVDR